MSKQPLVVKQGEDEAVSLMGVDIEFVCPGDRTGNAWSLMRCSARPDAGPPPHHHAWDEAYYILSGEVRFALDGRTVVLGAGEFIMIPGGTVHGFQGRSDTPARMLIFSAPAHADQFFRDASREVRKIPGDLAKVPEIGERHGIHFLPFGR